MENLATMRIPRRSLGPSIALCTLLLLISSTYPCGRWIEDRPITSALLYFILFVCICGASVWVSKKQAVLLIVMHLYTVLAAFLLVYVTSSSCPYVFSSPSLSDISISTVSAHYRNLTFEERHSVLFDREYMGGDFRFTDGEILLNYVIEFKHPRAQSWLAAPIVPSIAQFNKSRDVISAWAVAPEGRLFPNPAPSWKDRRKHEAFLLLSDQWKFEQVAEMRKKFKDLKMQPVAPLFQWRDISDTFGLAVSYLIGVNVLVYLVLGIVYVGTWYVRHKFLQPHESEDSHAGEVYLLHDMKSHMSARYGGVDTSNNHYSNGEERV